MGQRNNNPLLETRTYEVQLSDGSMLEYSANLIGENIYAQCDADGHQYMVFKEICDHRAGPQAISIEDGFIQSYNGNMHPK